MFEKEPRDLIDLLLAEIRLEASGKGYAREWAGAAAGKSLNEEEQQRLLAQLEKEYAGQL